VDGTPPENLRYLSDDVTGRPQHLYVLDEAHPHVGAASINWISQGPNDKLVKDKKPEHRWGRVGDQVTSLGHSCYPRLFPEVTVPVSRLPKDTFSHQHVQALYVAWMKVGMRCPVEGCEPWEALKPLVVRYLSHRPCSLQAWAGLECSVEDSRKMDVESITASRLSSFREHGYQNSGYQGLEGVVEHWQRFHMRKGQSFAALYCSMTPTQRLAATCHELSFPSMTAAADHMADVHGEEVRE
jgi:hypothetical protein